MKPTPILVFVSAVLVSGGAGVWLSNWGVGQHSEAVAKDSRRAWEVARETPFSFGPLSPAPKIDLEPRASWLNAMDVVPEFPANQRLSPSACIHLIKLHGQDAVVSQHGAQLSHSLKEILLSEELSREHFGQPAFVKTRYGVRFPTADGADATAGDESHRDQCLATFGEWGLPISFPLKIQSEEFQLRDVLRDSIENFQIDQAELDWTAIAYALYLPPVNRWENRFGEEFSFDDLAVAMLESPIEGLSCGGTHRFFALTVLLRIDRQEPFLSPSVRKRIHSYLEDIVNRSAKAQLADGSWEYSWQQSGEDGFKSFTRPDSMATRLIMTGHLAEWYRYLPADLAPDPIVNRRAAFWLAGQVRDAEPEHVWRELCPYTHAICSMDSSRSATRVDSSQVNSQ